MTDLESLRLIVKEINVIAEIFGDTVVAEDPNLLTDEGAGILYEQLDKLLEPGYLAATSKPSQVETLHKLYSAARRALAESGHTRLTPL